MSTPPKVSDGATCPLCSNGTLTEDFREESIFQVRIRHGFTCSECKAFIENGVEDEQRT